MSIKSSMLDLYALIERVELLHQSQIAGLTKRIDALESARRLDTIQSDDWPTLAQGDRGAEDGA